MWYECGCSANPPRRAQNAQDSLALERVLWGPSGAPWELEYADKTNQTAMASSEEKDPHPKKALMICSPTLRYIAALKKMKNKLLD